MAQHDTYDYFEKTFGRGLMIYTDKKFTLPGASVTATAYEYYTAEFWTLKKFDFETPTAKINEYDLPLADGVADFAGFNGRHYNRRMLTITLESSVENQKFRHGEIIKLQGLVGNQISLIQAWCDKIGFSGRAPVLIETLTEYETAYQYGTTYTGRVLGVATDFEDRAHCSVTITVSCEPYITANIEYTFLEGVRYIWAMEFTGYQFPAYNKANITASHSGSIDDVYYKSVEGETSTEVDYRGQTALDKLYLYSAAEDVMIPEVLLDQGMTPYNDFTVYWEGVKML